MSDRSDRATYSVNFHMSRLEPMFGKVWLPDTAKPLFWDPNPDESVACTDVQPLVDALSGRNEQEVKVARLRSHPNQKEPLPIIGSEYLHIPLYVSVEVPNATSPLLRMTAIDLAGKEGRWTCSLVASQQYVPSQSPAEMFAKFERMADSPFQEAPSGITGSAPNAIDPEGAAPVAQFDSLGARVFRLLSCLRHDSQVRCAFAMTNQGKSDTEISLGIVNKPTMVTPDISELTDRAGKTIAASTCQLDNQIRADVLDTRLGVCVRQRIRPGITIHGMVGFEGYDAHAEMIPILSISYDPDSPSAGVVFFNNVPLRDAP